MFPALSWTVTLKVNLLSSLIWKLGNFKIFFWLVRFVVHWSNAASSVPLTFLYLMYSPSTPLGSWTNAIPSLSIPLIVLLVKISLFALNRALFHSAASSILTRVGARLSLDVSEIVITLDVSTVVVPSVNVL